MTVSIVALEVDGFGALADVGIRRLPPGLVVLSGPNEAGKSTLLAFMRGVLFGFPDGRSRLPRYEPLRGGRHGGRVELDVDGARWVVERHTGPKRLVVRGPDGSEGGEEELRALLGGADAELFRTVFAFGLGELADLDTLSADGVRERIFSAGVVGAGRSATAAIATLDDRARRLLSPRAGRIRELERELAAAESRLRSARDEAHDHARAREAEGQASARVDGLRVAADRAATEERRVRRLLDLWRVETVRGQLQQELATLAFDAAVDEGSEARLAGLLERLRAAREAQESREGERRAALAAHGAVRCDDRLLAVAAEARSLARSRGAHVERAQRLVGLARQRDEAGAALAEELARLGPGWDRARLEGFDASIPAVDAVRGWGERTARAEGEARQAAAVAAERRTAAEAAARRRDAVNRELSEAGGAGLAVAVASLRALRAALAEQARRDAVAAAAGPALPVRRAAVAMAVALVAAAVVLLAVGQGAGAVVAALAAAAVGVLAYLVPGSTGEGTTALARERGAEEIADLALRAGVAGEPTTLAVEERATSLAAAQALQGEAERAALAAADAATAAAQAVWAADHASAHAEAEREAWAAEAARLGVGADRSPAAATDLFTSVERARGALRRLVAAERELDEERGRAEAFEARVRAAVAAAGHDGSTDDDAAAAVERLAELVELDARARAEGGRLAAELAEATRREADAARAVTSVETALAELLDGDDEAGFRARIARAARRAEVERALGDAVRSLREAAGAGEDAAELLEELGRGEVDAWHERLQRAMQRRGDLDAQRDEAVRVHEQARAALRAIEDSADVASRELERNALREERDRLVAEWQRLAIARGLVAETLARFERERQPAVLERAGEHFRAVTEGRYERLAVRDGGVDAIDASGRRVDAAALSRGTAEQLYLCLRLGLVSEFARAGTRALPLVLDDILVNFDPGRAEAVVDRLGAVAREQQVLLLTCHPHVVELVQRVEPATRVVELPRVALPV